MILHSLMTRSEAHTILSVEPYLTNGMVEGCGCSYCDWAKKNDTARYLAVAIAYLLIKGGQS